MSTKPDLSDIKIKGPFWTAQAKVLQTSRQDFLDEFTNFDNSQNWKSDVLSVQSIALSPEECKEHDADFGFRKLGQRPIPENENPLFFETLPKSWSNYWFSGKFNFSKQQKDVGIILCASKQDDCWNYYALVTRENGELLFTCFFPKDKFDHTDKIKSLAGKVPSNDKNEIYVGIKIKKESWYNFRVQLVDAGYQTEIRIVVWPIDKQEPERYNLQLADVLSSRLLSGTVGVLYNAKNDIYLRDFKVSNILPELWDIRSVFSDIIIKNKKKSIESNAGTFVALCDVHQATIHIGSETIEWKRPIASAADEIYLQAEQHLKNGRLSLLLLRSGENEQLTISPEFYCLNGHIVIDSGTTSIEDSAYGTLCRILHVDSIEMDIDRETDKKLLGRLTLHSAGAFIFSTARFPWSKFRPSAPLLLTQEFDDQSVDGSYRLTLDNDRLTNVELHQLKDIWSSLHRYINPKLFTDQGSVTTAGAKWVTLEMSNTDIIPAFYWRVNKEQNLNSENTLFFASDQFNVIFCDQNPYTDGVLPSSIARIIPTFISIQKGETTSGVDSLIVKSVAGEKNTLNSSMSYIADEKKGTEEFKINDIQLAYNAVQLARELRDLYAIETPRWTNLGEKSEPLSDPLLWSFMPLQDGWAQLPVANLTEQIYLDAELEKENSLDSQTQQEETVLQGGVTFGNSATYLQTFEHNWSVTLLGATYAECELLLIKNESEEYELSETIVQMQEPALAIDGLLWLSAEVPTTKNALPEAMDIVSGLKTVTLYTQRAHASIYPSPLYYAVQSLKFSSQQADEQKILTAKLGEWTLCCLLNQIVYNNLITKKVLPSDTFSKWKSLLWRRHATLPLIQALPMTQKREPANYPNASRQLMPFQISGIESDHNLMFSANGAKNWLHFIGVAQPAEEWSRLVDMPMVSLSLPGLIFDPNIQTLGKDEALLPLQYRYDLPYLDEIYALSTLPQKDAELKKGVDEEQIQKPLAREDFMDYWQQLAEQAGLAVADAVDALDQVIDEDEQEDFLQKYPGIVDALDRLLSETINYFLIEAAQRHNISLEKLKILELSPDEDKPYSNMPAILEKFSAAQNQMPEIYDVAEEAKEMLQSLKHGKLALLKHLVEPHHVISFFNADLNCYPGDIFLDLEHISNSVEGISMDLTPAQSTGLLMRSRNDTPAFQIKAGSMAAVIKNDAILDQRGLARSLSITNEKTTLLQTRAHLEGATPVYLTTSLVPISLLLAQGQTWQFWFKDIPFEKLTPQQIKAAKRRMGTDTVSPNFAFHRTDNRSPFEQDINDPEAMSRELNYRNQWEWRLCGSNLDAEYLEIFGLHFYPLRLETILAEKDQIIYIELVGRLQLPLENEGEQENFANAVSLVFAIENNVLSLQSVKLEETCEAGEWPLALKDGEPAACPHLLWKDIQLDSSKSHFVLQEAKLDFFLFEKRWTIDLFDFSLAPFSGATSGNPITLQLQSNKNVPLYPDRLEILLRLKDSPPVHQVKLFLGLKLGQPDEQKNSAFAADVVFEFTGAAIHMGCDECRLFDVLDLKSGGDNSNSLQLKYTRFALEFQWETISNALNLQLLPGMPIRTDETGKSLAPGFSAVTFHLKSEQSVKLQVEKSGQNGQADDVKPFVVSFAFVESLFECKWGHPFDAPETQLDDLFQASTGQLVFGYTGKMERSKLENWALQWQNSLNVNGVLDVMNLISWPILKRDNQNNIEIPQATSGVPDHIRHSIRILLNQHKIPRSILISSGEKSASVFEFDAEQSWQFPAVVEHRVCHLAFDSQSSEITLDHISNDKRWTCVQEVRFLSPKMLQRYFQQQQTIDAEPVFGMDMNSSLPWSDTLNILPEFEKIFPKGIWIEASAPQWISGKPVKDLGWTTLQYLPGGAQVAVPSAPSHYLPGDPDTQEWNLFITPFIGRILVPNAKEGDNEPASFSYDPVELLTKNDLSDTMQGLVAAFTNRNFTSSVSVRLPDFEVVLSRRWARLDPVILQENWFKLQHPLPEDQYAGIQSILVSFPEGFARLSRARALQDALTSFRTEYPPKSERKTSIDELSPIDLHGDVEWRQHGMLRFSACLSILAPKNIEISYPWLLFGLQIAETSWQTSTSTTSESDVTRYPAVTILPVQKQDVPDNRLPHCFAVSPYIGIDFWSTPESLSLERLVSSTELLCYDPLHFQLLPVSSVLDSKSEINVQQWGTEIHKRMAAHSTIAILRRREIKSISDASLEPRQPSIVVNYTFELVQELSTIDVLETRIFHLRSRPPELVFRDGHYGGSVIPANVHKFELAPPVIDGLQPIYLTQRPVPDDQPWWGLSTLKVSAKYGEITESSGGLSGELLDGNNSQDTVLWWQAIQQLVQFRSALDDNRPVAGLPQLFRARAVKSFIPTSNFISLPGLDFIVKEESWQPVLPLGLNCLLMGARPGVFFALRYILLLQKNLTFAQKANVSSSSLPAQHRMPRPVPIPAKTFNNKNGYEVEHKTESRFFEQEMQTWGSYFEPNTTVKALSLPHDEAFIASGGSRAAQRLHLTLCTFDNGVLERPWDGNFDFEVISQPVSDEKWDVRASVVMDAQSFVCTEKTAYIQGQLSFVVQADMFDALTAHLNQKKSGDLVYIYAEVKPAGMAENFWHTLTFQLRLRETSLARLPLQAQFLLFEDPEYNRRLSSESLSVTGLASVQTTDNNQSTIEMHNLTLSADRHEYNPDSLIFLRCDLTTTLESSTPHLTVKLLQSGVAITLLEDDTSMSIGSITKISLAELQIERNITIVAGDVIEVTLTLPASKAGAAIAITKEVELALKLNIVKDPVIPAPDAAYALLRKGGGESEQFVECARFAWGPEPSRIDLVNPEDFKRGTMRRRAVFKWQHSVRSGTTAHYAIQKIVKSGATHIPDSADFC
ncbi:hypothetical protein EH223_11515 [candidate division KSB1 bacterium]|nr:hypothetical protein [candidate division KSB1 bacterium]RQW02837.1 MAG: hypothetical protein EH223_11515 [candidate division KSB1 bacterium]